MSQLQSKVLANNQLLARSMRDFRDDNLRNGELARKLREQAGVSLRSLAKRMGISAPFLSDLERGYRTWSDKQALKWEEAMAPDNDNQRP